ncbi:MAG: DUF4824 family protein [Campylobacterota bacterium]|nr:DUF4824 family protein [Campylobacterota bacterium]
MKIYITSRRLFLSAFFTVIVINIIVLTEVFFNRSSEQKREITLTERELSWPYRTHKENSGLSLKLRWRVLKDVDERHSYYSKEPAWLNIEKLEELGFDIADDQKREPISREVFIVLEYDGEDYRRSMERTQAALKREQDLLDLSINDKKLRNDVAKIEKIFESEQTNQSRLFAVDAAIDPEILSKKYSDQTRFIIAKGLVKPRYRYRKKRIIGTIVRLSIENIHVPLEHRQKLDEIIAANKAKQDISKDPRYRVILNYGTHHEPWIAAILPY